MKTIKIEPEDTLSLPAPPKIGRGRGLLGKRSPIIYLAFKPVS